MKKRFLSLACAAGIISVITACGSGDSQSSTPKQVSYHASFPEFSSSEELYGKANLVVRAVVQPGSEVRELSASGAGSNNPELNPAAGVESAEAPAEEPLVVTVYKVKITKLHKGTVKVGDTIEVKELGGTLDGTEYISDESPSLVTGKPYLLFLTTFPDAPASMITPVQGQYPLDANGEPQPLAKNTLKMTAKDLEQLTKSANQ